MLDSNSLEELIQQIAKVPLKFQAGTDWAYSIAVDIQGYLVEKLSGQKFGDFLKQRIFDPLKMNDTAFQTGKAKASRLSGPPQLVCWSGLVLIDNCLGTAIALSQSQKDLSKMKKFVATSLVLSAFSIFVACGDGKPELNLQRRNRQTLERNKNNTTDPRLVNGENLKDAAEPVPAPPREKQKQPALISLNRGICHFEMLNEAMFEFDILCPVEIAKLKWEFINSGSKLEVTAKSYNGGGPVDISMQKVDTNRVKGHARGSKLVIAIVLADGRTEILQTTTP